MKVHPKEILDLLEQIQRVRSEPQFLALQRNIPYIINRIYSNGIGEED